MNIAEIYRAEESPRSQTYKRKSREAEDPQRKKMKR
jgi:hypothetical protein